MGMGSDNLQAPLRSMLLGESKRKKTWWACMAAHFGYNVILFDGDAGSHIITQLHPLARARIRIINCADTMQKVTFCNVMGRFYAGTRFLWDDTANELPNLNNPLNPEHAFFLIDPAALTPNDVVIWDSWTSLAISLASQYARENNIDFGVNPPETYMRGMYGWMQLLADKNLTRMQGVKNFHQVLIAHMELVDVTKKGKGKNNETIQIPTGEQVIQAFSTSRAHAKKIATKFSDVLFFELAGSKVMIDSRPAEGREGGSRLLHERGEWEGMLINRFTEILGYAPTPDAPMPGCVYYPPGTYVKPVQPIAITTNGGGNVTASGAQAAQPQRLVLGTPAKAPTLNISLATATPTPKD